MAEKRAVPPGECTQCWSHSKVHSRWMGLFDTEDCAPCLNHKDHGCPPNMIVPKPKNSWW
ncbi:pRL2-8 [Streptomyces sp. SID10116]|uniref:PRL2-8 n=1 Tax=Streptomyces venezuelae TaxID=54571 RepID=A0A5P2B7H3_STRVZ|nr:pRL2-8 [Streptomyces sp. SID10116]QES25850.1 pRL2-8 [Streptomyces venezuelae]